MTAICTLRLALAGLVRAPGRTRAAGRRGRRRGRAARRRCSCSSGNSLRTSVGERRAPGAARLAGSRHLATRRTSGRPGGRQASRASPQASATATAPFAGVTPHGPGGQHDARASGVGARRAAATTSRTSTPSACCTASLRPGGVVLDQQMAATLQARIGDTVRLVPRAGAPPQRYTVSGVALITAPDQALPAAQPAARPGPGAAARRTSRSCRSARSRGRSRRTLPPITPPARSARAPSPARRTGVQWQVQAQLDPAPLGAGSPRAALDARRPDAQPRRALAARPGAVRRQPLRLAEHRGRRRALRADALHHARGPGALIALGLAYLAALGTGRARPPRPRAAARPRRHVGATCSALAGVESVVDRRGRRAARRRRSRFAAVALLVSGGAQLTAGAGAGHRAAPASCSAIAGAAAARIGATASVLARGGGRGTRSAVGASASRCGSGSTSTWSRSRVSGLIYWLDRAHRLLGGRQPRLEPDAVAVGLHVLRARRCCGSARRCCWCGCAGARSPGLARRGCSAGGREHAARLPRWPAPARRGRGDQPRPRRGRPAARLRRQPRRSSRPPTTSRRRSTRS